MEKISKDSLNLTILFVVAFFIFVLIIVSVTTAYFSSNNTAQGTIQLGELDFSLTSTSAQSDIVMPNSYVGQSTSIINSRDQNGNNYSNLCSILYNFSVYATIDDQIDDELTDYLWYQIDDQKYIQADDGAFYYVGFLNAGESETLFNDVFLDAQIGNEYQGKSLKFYVNINAIQAENDAYKELWNDAPEEWIDAIEDIFDESY